MPDGYPPYDEDLAATTIRETSALFGVTVERVESALAAANYLTDKEMAVIDAMLEMRRSGVEDERRAALATGILDALKALPPEEAEDPLAAVDEPMSAAEAMANLAWAEQEANATREAVLRESLSVAEAAYRVGRSRQALERLRRQGRALALRVRQQWRYPVWQLDPDAPGGIVAGLDEVLEGLDLSPLGAAYWLRRPHPKLGNMAPIEALRRGRREEVVSLARQAGQVS